MICPRCEVSIAEGATLTPCGTAHEICPRWAPKPAPRGPLYKGRRKAAVVLCLYCAKPIRPGEATWGSLQIHEGCR